jgi:hypothetical protein
MLAYKMNALFYALYFSAHNMPVLPAVITFADVQAADGWFF